MSAIDDQEAILRALLAPGRYARALMLGALAVALATGAHAVLSVQSARPRFRPCSSTFVDSGQLRKPPSTPVQSPQDPTLSLVQRLHLSDLALVPDEDLRHPGWGRAEQGRVGQPGLPDPRGAKTLLRPVPMKVSK